MARVITEKAEKTDGTGRFSKTDGFDKTGQRRAILPFSKVLAGVRALLKSYGLNDGGPVSGALGFCIHGQTATVCYLAEDRTAEDRTTKDRTAEDRLAENKERANFHRVFQNGSDQVPSGIALANIALANIDTPQIDDPENLSLYQLCERMFNLSARPLFPQVWVSTDLARGGEVAVHVPGFTRHTLVFSAAQELGQHLARVAADLSNSGHDESWLEQAKPEEPPAFDYRLLQAKRESASILGPFRRRGHLHGNSPADSAVAQSRYWWMAGDASRGLLTQLQGHGLEVAGITPDGVALYWGLQRLWRGLSADQSVLRGPWVLVEDSGPLGLWLYSGCWFQSRRPLESLEALQTSELGEQTKVVLWLTKKNTVQALAESLAATSAVFDHTLSPWSPGMGYQRPALGVPSIIALGSALQGSRQPSGDWQEDDAPPIINLLPWRGAWLKRRQRRLFFNFVALGLAFSGCAYVLFEALQRQADLSYQRLVDARAGHQQLLETQQRVKAQDHAQTVREAALARLGVHGNFGQRQLLNAEALLALVPECFVVHRIALTKNSATIFGWAPNVNRLITLPETIFAAFSQDQHRSLESWPTLLLGTDAAKDSYPLSLATTPMSDLNNQSDNQFSLRVVFAPAEVGETGTAEHSETQRFDD